MIVQAESNQNGEAMQMTDNIHSSMLENEWGMAVAARMA